MTETGPPGGVQTAEEVIRELWEDDLRTCLSILIATGSEDEVPTIDEMRQMMSDEVAQQLGDEIIDALNRGDPLSASLLDHVRRLTEKKLDEFRDELHRVVCVEFDFCAKLRKYGDELSLLAGSLVTVLAAGLDLTLAGIPIASLSTYGTKRYFKRLCNCT